PYTWLTGWVNCAPPPEWTKLPPWVTLVIRPALLLRRVRMSFPDPWMTAPMLLAAIHGADPACTFVIARAAVGSTAPRSPTTRVAPGATYRKKEATLVTSASCGVKLLLLMQTWLTAAPTSMCA